MSYILEKFGTLTLPQSRPTTDVGAGSSFSSLVALPSGGAYDAIGSARARGNPITVNHSAAVVGANTTAVQTLLDALKAQIGKRDRLYRRLPDGSINWITARLVSLESRRVVENIRLLDIQMTFASPEYYWHGTHHGAGWVLDSGIYLDSGYALDEATGDVFTVPASGNITVNNAGNYPVRNCIITVSPGATTAMTVFTIIKTGVTSLKYTATIATGKSLVIDCGAFTVLNDGVDDYSHFTREAGHVTADWITLEPEDNVFALTRTGGNTDSTITFTFDDGRA